MKKMKILLFVINAFLFPLVTWAQDMVCEKLIFSYVSDSKYYKSISFEDESGNVESREENLFFHVDALLDINNLQKDTVTLTTTISGWPILGAQELKVTKNDGTILPSWIETNYDSIACCYVRLLKFVLKRDAKVTVSYNLLGSSMLRYGTDNDMGNMGIDSYQQRQEYYYPKDIPIKEIEIKSSDIFLPIASYARTKDGSLKDINLAFVVRNQHFMKSIRVKDVEIDVFVPDTLLQKEFDGMQKKLEELRTNIKTLALYMPPVKRHTSIILINWRSYKTRQAGGEAFGNFILADVKFGGSSLFHEVLHTLLPTDIREGSKGAYFLGESVIEWLTLFLSDKSIKSLDELKEVQGNLYDTAINASPTWSLIYSKGPAIIEQVAQKFGRGKMARCLIGFYIEHADEEIDYNTFYSYLQERLPSDLLDELDTWVKK